MDTQRCCELRCAIDRGLRTCMLNSCRDLQVLYEFTLICYQTGLAPARCLIGDCILDGQDACTAVLGNFKVAALYEM